MITVYEIEIIKPVYYGLCGIKIERWIAVEVGKSAGTIDEIAKANGDRITRKREFPTKTNTGSFVRRLN